jgi:hypothetical protein
MIHSWFNFKKINENQVINHNSIINNESDMQNL